MIDLKLKFRNVKGFPICFLQLDIAGLLVTLDNLSCISGKTQILLKIALTLYLPILSKCQQQISDATVTEEEIYGAVK